MKINPMEKDINYNLFCNSKDNKEYKNLKAKFLKLIANVPLPLRNEIIALIDEKTISWDVAYGEIQNDTKNTKTILNNLKKIGLL